MENVKSNSLGRSPLDKLRHKVAIRCKGEVPSLLAIAGLMGFQPDPDSSKGDFLAIYHNLPNGDFQYVMVNPVLNTFQGEKNGRKIHGDVVNFTLAFPEYFVRNYIEEIESYRSDLINGKQPLTDQQLENLLFKRTYSLTSSRWEEVAYMKMQIVNNCVTYGNLFMQELSKRSPFTVKDNNVSVEKEEIKGKMEGSSVSPKKVAPKGIQPTGERKQPGKKQPATNEQRPHIRDDVFKNIPSEQQKVEYWLDRIGFKQDPLETTPVTKVYREESMDLKIVVTAGSNVCYDVRQDKGYVDIVGLSFYYPDLFAQAMGVTPRSGNEIAVMWREYMETNNFAENKGAGVSKETDDDVYKKDRKSIPFETIRYHIQKGLFSPDGSAIDQNLYNYIAYERCIPDEILKEFSPFMTVVKDLSSSVGRSLSDIMSAYGDYFVDEAEAAILYRNLFLHRYNKENAEKAESVFKDFLKQTFTEAELADLNTEDKDKLMTVPQVLMNLMRNREMPYIGFPIVTTPKIPQIKSESKGVDRSNTQWIWVDGKAEKYEDMQLAGFELKAARYKRNAAMSNTTEGMWLAVRAPFAEVRSAYFFESAFDALSFVAYDRSQAKVEGRSPRFDLDKDMLVSCVGGPKKTQISKLKHMLPKDVNLFACFDMDAAGRKFAFDLNEAWSSKPLVELRTYIDVDKKTIMPGEYSESLMKELISQGYAIRKEYSKSDRGKNPNAPIELVKSVRHVSFMAKEQTAFIPEDELSIKKVRDLIPEYQVNIKVLYPHVQDRNKFMKRDPQTGKKVEAYVKDWNDRLLCEKYYRSQSVLKQSGVAKRLKDREAQQQQEIDDRINKANERMRNKDKSMDQRQGGQRR